MIDAIKLAWSTMSLSLKAALIGGPILAIILIAGGVHLWHRHTETGLVKQQEQLKAENVKITDAYNEALGKAHAFETSAREEKMKADSYKATVEAGNKNVKALDVKLETAKGNYEQAKADLGDCANSDDCLQRLCKELKAAGFKVPNCD